MEMLLAQIVVELVVLLDHNHYQEVLLVNALKFKMVLVQVVMVAMVVLDSIGIKI